MSKAESALDDLSTLPATVENLTSEVRALRQVLDEIRDEIGWATRNLPEAVASLGGRRITSMPVDPCEPDWAERVNRFTPADLPGSQPPESPRGTTIHVDAEQFAKAMESVEQLVYCCESPELAWTGDPEQPGVECRQCGYIVAEAGSVTMNPADDETEKKSRPEPDHSKQNRFEESDDDDPTDEDDQLSAKDGDEDTASHESTQDNCSVQPPPVATTPRRKHSQPLSMRLIFQPLMTDLVRVFGYATLTQEEAKQGAAPLIEKYGLDRVADAAAEIVEETTVPPRHFRLTEEARRLSVQILGRPPVANSGAENNAANATDYNKSE